ncbi:MAG: excinuclease ABC subunit UvrA, partial [Gammaproteobacteria bacterium]|nr:excinuclease ABC subunit UvrA [Gammaproteobacteria bacterium]
MDKITIKGARTHNLKNLDLEIPRDKLIVITGLSGSGKSSLAFDTLYAEGQRRYVESLSAYARQFLSLMEKPDVDHIDGLSPAISIEQKTTSHNPRSTVGTITEIYDYLRLLYARVGTPMCPEHQVPLKAMSVSQMVDQIMNLPENLAVMLLAPVVSDRKGEHQHVFRDLMSQGYVRARIDGLVTDLDQPPTLEKNRSHNIEVVIDRFRIRDDIRVRLADSLETAVSASGGTVILSPMENDSGFDETVFSANHACPLCGHSVPELEPRLFSFNNPAGACQACSGLGIRQFFDSEKLIRDRELSLSEGAIHGWDRRNIYYYQMLSCLSDHYGFGLDVPLSELADKHLDIILYGSGRDKIEFRYVNERGDTYTRSHAFEGILPGMERRYRDTESEAVRDSLAAHLSIQPCSECRGTRLNASARSVVIAGKSLPDVVKLSISNAHRHFTGLELEGQRAQIADKILREIEARLGFLVDVGLNYLTLSRSADTLSGGEAQRIRLASQIGAGLVGVMYILDEPSIGLHQRDNQRLLDTLIRLRDLGNTVMVVEHDEEAIRCADHIIDMGPGAGVHGGEVVASGSIDAILQSEVSVTGQYLSGRRKIDTPCHRKKQLENRCITIKNAKGNNLKNITVSIPAGLMTCITGVSGSGKSTLINQTLLPVAARKLNGATKIKQPEDIDISGLEHFDKVVDIDQSPIGRTPRSNPATYTNLFTNIRDIFSATSEARSRGYKVGRFSFNVKGGRCEACQGDGVIRVEMHFLSDIYVTCDECQGRRYNRETLEIRYKGKTIHEVLEMTVEDALAFFDAVPAIKRKLETLMEVGLSYIKLGQSAVTLSG